MAEAEADELIGECAGYSCSAVALRFLILGTASIVKVAISAPLTYVVNMTLACWFYSIFQLKNLCPFLIPAKMP